MLGLRPVRAALLDTEKVPKPTSEILSPLESEPVIASIIPLSAFAASVLVISADSAIAATNSCMFLVCSLAIEK